MEKDCPVVVLESRSRRESKVPYQKAQVGDVFYQNGQQEESRVVYDSDNCSCFPVKNSSECNFTFLILNKNGWRY